MNNISYKDLKRQPLFNVLESYQDMVSDHNKQTNDPHIRDIDSYLNSDVTLSEEEYDEVKLNIDNLAIKIIKEFEELLNKNDIKIPDKFREGDEDEACIYGETYYKLEDKIKEILINNI